MVKKKKQQTLSTEDKILAAARKVFTTKGKAAARMQDIADEAGINKALLHYYFRDKNKLFDTIFLTEARKFFPRINMIFELEAPLFEKIEKFVAEYVDEMRINPYLPLFVLNEINHDPKRFLQKIWGKGTMPKPEKFLQQIESEIKKGTIRKIQPMQLLMNMISLTIFPFVAEPMFTYVLRMPDKKFDELMEQRKVEIPQFIIASIKK